MDALDGGAWQFGDDSVPTVGVTYFAGTFVRHPLALAAAKAVLEHLKAAGPGAAGTAQRAHRADGRRAQRVLRDGRRADRDQALRVALEASASPKTIRCRTSCSRCCESRGIHILDNFPCFLTTAHGEADFAAVVKAFKESVQELQEAEFLPQRRSAESLLLDANKPPVPGARLGKDRDGQPAWFVPNPDAPGKFVKVGT